MTSRLVLVTGASSGIGEATARRYGASGAHVLLLARNADRLDEAVGAIRKDGGTATAYPVDLADPKAIEEVSARMTREAGTPDVLINNAGAGRWLPIVETSAEEALAMIEVPYLAAFNLTRAFLPKMLARRSGAIACITSPASYIVWPNAAAYTAARHALAGFTEALRTEMKRLGDQCDPRRARHGREPLLGAQSWQPRALSGYQSEDCAPDVPRGRRRSDFRRRRGAQAKRGQADDLARSVLAQRFGSTPRREPAPPLSAEEGLTRPESR